MRGIYRTGAIPELDTAIRKANCPGDWTYDQHWTFQSITCIPFSQGVVSNHVVGLEFFSLCVGEDSSFLIDVRFMQIIQIRSYEALILRLSEDALCYW